MSKHSSVDTDFLALPLEATSDAAIAAAQSLGASHVDVRIEKTRTGCCNYVMQSLNHKVMTQSLDSVFALSSMVRGVLHLHL
jgi:TldD protein